MKRIVTCLFVLIIASCSSKKKIPDVSQIKVDLQTVRFEKDFFALDTNNMAASLQALYNKHKGFTQDYFFNILGIPPNKDSVANDSKLFLSTYKNIYFSSIKTFENFEPIQEQVKQGLQFVNYYFPKYPLPKKIVTFIGPLNGSWGIIMPDNSLAVGLQVYLGKDYPVYKTGEVLDMYPEYVSRRFEPEYIPVNCMKNVIDDIFLSYPPAKKSTQLIEQMVDEGKKLYILDAFLPYTPDSLKTGYTQLQLDNSYAAEKEIWTYFVENDLLYQTDPSTISGYVNDGPKTTELGEWSPGNVGLFVGWQIVKKWMDKNEKATLQQLIQTPSKQIFEEAKYKPH